jgi:RimJ/RimL family protein N-acetyltransferase
VSVRLEPFAEAHLERVDGLLSDPEVLRFTLVPDEPPAGFARDWMERYRAGREEGVREGFVAVDDDGRFLGLALAVDIQREARQMELGYIVAPAARGRGVGTELLRALTDWAFAEGALRVYLVIAADNVGSQRVAERSGYVREGVMRSAHFKAGRRYDATLWSRLPSDPPPE